MEVWFAVRLVVEAPVLLDLRLDTSCSMVLMCSKQMKVRILLAPRQTRQSNGVRARATRCVVLKDGQVNLAI